MEQIEPHTVPSVSYTHLDVYKRQEYLTKADAGKPVRRPDWIWFVISAGCSWLAAGTVCLWPVSYTHLDVYKRQQYLNLQWKRRYYEPGSFSMRILAADYDPRVKFLYTCLLYTSGNTRRRIRRFLQMCHMPLRVGR